MIFRLADLALVFELEERPQLEVRKKTVYTICRLYLQSGPPRGMGGGGGVAGHFVSGPLATFWGPCVQSWTKHLRHNYLPNFRNIVANLDNSSPLLPPFNVDCIHGVR